MDEFLNVENDLLQAGIDEIENDIENMQTVGKPYTVRPRFDPFAEFSESDFKKRFRLSKDSVEYLYQLIGNDLEPLSTRENFTISGMQKILITLRYLATASYHVVSYTGNLSIK